MTFFFNGSLRILYYLPQTTIMYVYIILGVLVKLHQHINPELLIKSFLLRIEFINGYGKTKIAIIVECLIKKNEINKVNI